jgi:GH15 family glucan-1,4-alpha-glucosidase
MPPRMHPRLRCTKTPVTSEVSDTYALFVSRQICRRNHCLSELNAKDMAFPAIQDYAIVGDCRSAALIADNGSLDWLCWPRFDSPTIFAGLLDPIRGGHWIIAPYQPYSVRRKYIENTNVLQTEFMTPSGSVVLTDLMPVSSEEYKRTAFTPDHQILRQVECLSGQVTVNMEFVARPNFAISTATIRDRKKLGIQILHGRCVYWLRSNMPMDIQNDRVQTRIVLKTGDTAQFSLSYSEDGPAVLPPLGDPFRESIARAVEWWQQWARRAKYDGPYREAVVRSALALKLLAYAPSGAIVAASTTSLPERIGGDWNWDYRYCWLRDASLTIRALLGLGYFDEADDFMDWMLTATRLTRPELRIMYDVYGETAPQERTLDHLSGYRDSRPVRVGNGARDQLQLDVYGEVLDAAAQYCFHGGTFDREMQRVLIGFGKYVVKHWHSPDEGIWEPRSSRRNHTHSRLLCWTALDRLISLSEQEQIRNAPVDEFRQHREAIRKQLCGRGWNSSLQSYVSTLDGSELDASLLLLSWYGFEKADSSRMRSTYLALRRELGARNNVVYRYQAVPPEGAFAICSFWEVEYLALGGGSLQDGQSLFQHLLGFRSGLGLYAEEIDPDTGDALGNYPQAFTHVGLVSAALSLGERAEGAEQLAHREKDAAKSDLIEAST